MALGWLAQADAECAAFEETYKGKLGRLAAVPIVTSEVMELDRVAQTARKAIWPVAVEVVIGTALLPRRNEPSTIW